MNDPKQAASPDPISSPRRHEGDGKESKEVLQVKDRHPDAFCWMDEDGHYYISLPHLGDAETEENAWKIAAALPPPIAAAGSQQLLNAKSMAATLYLALERIQLNAKRIFQQRSVRDWEETLAEADAAIESYKLASLPSPGETK